MLKLRQRVVNCHNDTIFFTSMGFYGKRLDLYANKLPKYVHKSQFDPLDIKHMMHVPQQEDSSKYVFLYFTDFIRKINLIYFLKCFFFEFFSVIVVCTRVYLLNTSVMVFLICVLLISMQSIIVKGAQSYDIMEKQRMRMA